MDTPLGQQLDRHQPVHFIGVGGIGMSAIAGILADRGYAVSGSDPRDNAVLQDLRSRGVRVFREQSAATINAIRSGTSKPPLVVVSSAHRGESFRACEFLMDYLKTRAPFWKQVESEQGRNWVDAKATDDRAADRWGRSDTKPSNQAAQ